MSILRFYEWITAGALFLIPLAFWPPALQPFSTAKEWLGLIWILLTLSLACSGRLLRERLPSRALLAGAIWIIAISLSAGRSEEASIGELIRNLLPCIGFILLVCTRPRPRLQIQALILSATLVAAIALLQYVSLDPYRMLNLTGSLQGSRVRVFSTLGNPNFVAAFLTAALLLTFWGFEIPAGKNHRTWRVFRIISLALQAGAIAATGSRAPVLGLLLGGIWLLFRKSEFRMPVALTGLAFGILLIFFSPARPLKKTIEGRIYIWQTTITHIWQIPITGFGPGAFRLRFAEWETSQLKNDPESSDNSFAGLQDHAHNDYLEYLVDYGMIGLVAFLAVVWLAASHSLGSSNPLQRAVSASTAALLGIALVDFPLHRPTEWYLFWILLALLWTVDRDAPFQENQASSL